MLLCIKYAIRIAHPQISDDTKTHQFDPKSQKNNKKFLQKSRKFLQKSYDINSRREKSACS